MQADERNKQLGESFRQSRRETVVICMAWAVFLAWTGIGCGLGSHQEGDEPVRTILGMPRWVFFGVVLPWLAACAFTVWFSMVYMQDTDLDPDRSGRENEA